MVNYYNEIDPFVAAWIRELIADGLVPKGDVDERDIREIKPSDLDGYVGCHFFAGISGWAYALRLAGWPDGRPVWTGSCPCQPFSIAGKGGGVDDDRHLWPAFRWLIAQRRPTICFGEQVAPKAGRAWLAGVRIDLEALGYAVGSADLCAAGVGAPHIRQRLWWVADAESKQPYRARDAGRWRGESANDGRMGDAEGNEQRRKWEPGQGDRQEGENRGPGFWSDTTWHQCRDGKARRIPKQTQVESDIPAMVDGLQDTMGDERNQGILEAMSGFPLAQNIPARVGLLKCAGNAIVPQVAAEFIKAYSDPVKIDPV